MLKLTFKEKKCTKCGNSYPVTHFKDNKGKNTLQCQTCRDIVQQWKQDYKERNDLINHCYKNELDYKVVKKDMEIQNKASPKRKENIFIDGIEYAWCSAECKKYVVTSNFYSCSVKQHFNGLKSECIDCVKIGKKRTKQNKQNKRILLVQ